MRALSWLQRRIFWLLLVSYALGALVPNPGILLRKGSLGTIHVGPGEVDASISMLLIAFLLGSAGVCIELRDLRRLVLEPTRALLGVVTNVAWPALFVLGAAAALAHRAPDLERECLVVGLAIAGAMPIASASTTWSNNSDGDVTLSLGLVLASTMLCPLTTPLVLGAAERVTRGDFADALDHLARHSSVAFLIFAVILPSLLGMAARVLFGPARILRAMPLLKALGLADLLLLNYANATATLPKLVASPNVRFIVLALAATILMCAGGFLLGWALGKLLRAPRGDTVALTFAIGMSNNGTGLVLAATSLANEPLVLLPILTLTLVQQTAAGITNTLLRRASPSCR